MTRAAGPMVLALLGVAWMVGSMAAGLTRADAPASPGVQPAGTPAAVPAAAPVPHAAGVPAGFKETSAVMRTKTEGAAAIDPTTLRTATFGAGCFWGVEARFRELPGVTHTAVGYLGGKTKNPTYKQVCTDSTGHAEVVQILYDPATISYDKLLEVFFTSHDPTTLNRQGPDVGSQYRSAVFFHDESQRAAYPRHAAGNSLFYNAEEYHQQYLEKRGMTHCHTP